MTMSSDVYIQRYDYIKKIVNQTTQRPKEKKDMCMTLTTGVD